MNKKSKLVFGIGVVDADYPVYMTETVDGKQKILWTCPFYQSWKNMLRRCYSPALQSRRSSYIGCTVALEWHSLMAFRFWMQTQDWQGKQLDKDILMAGNKVYSSDACVFVSGALNNFLTDSAASRGDLPIGVCWDKLTGKYRAMCRNPFTRRLDSLGYFYAAKEAHEAWRAKKHEHACRYAEQQADPRIAYALRQRYSGNG